MLQKFALIGLLAATLPVQAQVYKCPKDGKTVFSDQPCDMNAVPVIPARAEDSQPSFDTGDLKRSSVNKIELAAVTSISLSPHAINSSASAARDAWKVSIYFKDRDDKTVYLREVDGIRYTATVYEERDGARGPVVGRASGTTIRDFGHEFIVKVSTRRKTYLLTEAAITLPDGRRFDAIDQSLFMPGPL